MIITPKDVCLFDISDTVRVRGLHPKVVKFCEYQSLTENT